MLTPGGDRDFMHTVALLGQVNIPRGNTLEDYGAKVVRGYIASQGASYPIPHRECADVVRHVNRCTSQECQSIECFFQKFE